MSFHLLHVTTTGYCRRKTFKAESLGVAANEALLYRRNVPRPWAVVLRDGSTGKRYSIEECQQIVKELTCPKTL